jgi:uncharacterized SAM-binding protein YcdF (DUF218 family)
VRFRPGRETLRYVWGRTGRWFAVAAALIVVTMGVAGYPVYVTPRADPVPSGEPVDAVVALGGLPESAQTARRLFDEGRARHLVLSNPYGRAKNVVTGLCRDVAAGAPGTQGVTCFVPDPSTTRGEAQEIARMARAQHWDRVIVVAPTFHLSRARMIVRRCYAGELMMVDARADIGAVTWVYQFGYQTAGYLKAFTQRGC